MIRSIKTKVISLTLLASLSAVEPPINMGIKYFNGIIVTYN